MLVIKVGIIDLSLLMQTMLLWQHRSSLNAFVVLVVHFISWHTLCVSALTTTHQKLPPCALQQDTYGSWLNVSIIDYDTNPVTREFIDSHFFGGGPGEAMNFSMIWLPHNCSYHRFTAATLEKMVEYIQAHDSKLTDGIVTIVFLGDSVTRGLYCSISRILAGSEVFGPLDNEACGNAHRKFVNSNPHYPFYDVTFFGGKFKMSFCFVTSLVKVQDRIEWKLEWSVTRTKPFAVSFNTGAWDFCPDAQVRYVKPAGIDTCNSTSDFQHVTDRTALRANTTFHDISWMGYDSHVKTIYRNIHYNARFGALCADEAVEKMIMFPGSHWEIYDSRRLSQDVWESQTEDGLHIDRKYAHTVEEHEFFRKNAEQLGRPYPGMLEMQLTQSFLNGVFHHAIHHLHSYSDDSSQPAYNSSTNTYTNTRKQ